VGLIRRAYRLLLHSPLRRKLNKGRREHLSVVTSLTPLILAAEFPTVLNTAQRPLMRLSDRTAMSDVRCFGVSFFLGVGHPSH
jgi:hypothetical protein